MTPVDLIVRAARLGDLDRVLSVHSAHDPGARGVGPASALEWTTWEQIQETSGLTVYLAEAGGHPVGTASLLVMPNLTYGCAPTAFIEAVVVVPHMRRLGVATAVLRQVLVDAVEAGCDKVQLLSHKRHASDGAHALYAAAGFSAEAEGFRRYLRSRPPSSSTEGATPS